MIWNSYDNPKINNIERSADKAERKADRTTEEVRQLESQIDRLTLACQSMWELLRERAELTDTELEEKILEVDLRDGKADGKIGPQIIACPNCNRNTNSKRQLCMMCGAPLLGYKTHPF